MYQYLVVAMTTDTETLQSTTRTTIKREFTIPVTQGAAALLVGSTAEGLPLISMKRKGEQVVAVYGDKYEIRHP